MPLFTSSETVLPQKRELPYQLNVEMKVNQNGDVIYYYDINDYRNMNKEDFKKNFPKIFKQIKNQNLTPIGKTTNNTSNMNNKCAGTYKVSGYVRSNGVRVSSYERTCGAKHLGLQKASEKYKGLTVAKMTDTELNELLEELI